jgi:hypothetical protein
VDSLSRTRVYCIDASSTGTSSIVHEKTHQPLLSTLASVVETVVRLRSQGHKVILVSSGAIGVGLKRMDMHSKPKSLSGKQVRCPFESIDHLHQDSYSGLGCHWPRAANSFMGQSFWAGRATHSTSFTYARRHIRCAYFLE